MRSILDQLAVSLGRNDEEPNIALAQTIAAGKDTEAIAELISLLDNRNQAIRSDALKVLYEAGKIEPSLIAAHADRFALLLSDRHNRMVWGGMEALAAIAGVAPGSLLPHLEAVMHATDTGSVITRDWGVRTLTSVAVALPATRQDVAAFLFGILERCKDSEFPRHLESMVPLLLLDDVLALDAQLLANRRLPDLTPPQAKRARRVFASIQ